MMLRYLIIGLISISYAQAAMVPLQSTFNPADSTEQQPETTARLQLRQERADPLLRFIVRNRETEQELVLSAGEYAMEPGHYHITLIRLDGIERNPDPNYQQVTDTITLTADQTISRTFPIPIRRYLATWHDDWSISLPTMERSKG